jgi:hypothetical protein
VTVKCPNDHGFTVIIDDLGRWGSCGLLAQCLQVPVLLGLPFGRLYGCLGRAESDSRSSALRYSRRPVWRLFIHNTIEPPCGPAATLPKPDRW